MMKDARLMNAMVRIVHLKLVGLELQVPAYIDTEALLTQRSEASYER